MVLGITEDFTSNVVLDTDLTGVPASGLYLNSGVHPSITLSNLLSFLPSLDATFAAWAIGTTYGKYETSRNRGDIVTKSGVIYQSLQIGNIGHDPATSSAYWLPTNIESLRLKSFIATVKDKVYADLSLTKRLVNNQYLYEEGYANTVTLPGNYAAWVFEPKGSDYISLRINEMSIQKAGTTPVDVYVINQGSLIDTLQVTPDNGKLSFNRLDYTFSGKGKLMFVIDSTDVITSEGYVDSLKYNGFVAYTAVGLGDAPGTATYSYGSGGNGMGFNISAYVDSNVYIQNNLNELANYVRATFEYMTFQMFLHNSNNRSNRKQLIQMDDSLLVVELKTLDADTVVSRYHSEKKKAIKELKRTFDLEVGSDDDLEIMISSV